MLSYHEYEKKVYDWLMEKNKQDSNFTFSIRQKANKGAELDYFIGTKKSMYFGTTFWTIPVSFPGSSTDLIDVFLHYEDENLKYYIEFNQIKDCDSDQNCSALNLIRKIKEEIRSNIRLSRENKPKHKMESFRISAPKSYDLLDDLLKDLDGDLLKLIPIVEKYIVEEKKQNENFIAHRITLDEFAKMKEKFARRLKKYEYSKLSLGEVKVENDNDPVKSTSASIPLNQIFFGPPGTGKTYHTINKAIEIIGEDLQGNHLSSDDIESMDRVLLKNIFDAYIENGQIVFTTFHQSMSYEDFIEGIKPVQNEDANQLEYEIVDGIFKQICLNAKDKNKNHILIIDEINRGNVSSIFGELITLIEKNKRIGGMEELKVVLPYSKEYNNKFGVPSNLYIIGTMNTADRSVEALDTALRRRFTFDEMPPKYDVIQNINPMVKGIDLVNLLKTINKRIEILLDRDHLIGHSYFLNIKNVNGLKKAFSKQIIPLLQEYFFGDYGKISLILGEGFCKGYKIDNVTKVFANTNYYETDAFEDKIIYTISNVSDAQFNIKNAIDILLKTQDES